MSEETSSYERWARLRFAIVGPLLAAPPKHGELQVELKRLSKKRWRHPMTGEPLCFGASTIERWYYVALKTNDPIGALRRRVRGDAGCQPSVGPKLRTALAAQWKNHKSWSYQLHFDNIQALAKEKAELGRVPSYPTVRRYMKCCGFRRRRKKKRYTPGAEQAAARLEAREVRSYEAEYVHGLWHSDFHECSRAILTSRGEWVKPHLFCALDDCSRIVCHAQWYLEESSETFAHGTSQAFQKRGLPREYMTDNGGAETAGEIEAGLDRLSIIHPTTLPYSPYQNAKQEVFWAQVEGRLMPMLEDVDPLTLSLLNGATQPWVEFEYHRKVHDELGMTPLERYLEGPGVGRESPGSEELRCAFRLEQKRKQRRSDGTVSIEAHRFEVPSRYRHLEWIWVRYSRWDLSLVHMVDERSGAIIARLYPQDKNRNADGRRRRLDPPPHDGVLPEKDKAQPGEIAPLLRQLMGEYAATGLPPAYLPHERSEPHGEEDDENEEKGARP